MDYCVVYNCVVLSSRDTGASSRVYVSRMRNPDHLYDDIAESQMLPQWKVFYDLEGLEQNNL